MRREQSVSVQALIHLVHVDRARIVEQNLRVDTQAIGDNLPNPQQMGISAIELILTGPPGAATIRLETCSAVSFSVLMMMSKSFRSLMSIP